MFDMVSSVYLVYLFLFIQNQFLTKVFCKLKKKQNEREIPNNQTVCYGEAVGDDEKEELPFKRKRPPAEPVLCKHLLQPVGG